MSKYEYIIFDLDGTLIDPKIGQINSVDYALKSFNIYEPNKEILSKFIGPPLKESFAKYYNFNEEQIEKGISPLQCEIYNSFKHNNLDKIFINKNYWFWFYKLVQFYKVIMKKY